MPRTEQREALAALRQRLGPAVRLLAPVYFVTSGMTVDIPGPQAGDLGDFVVSFAAACAGEFIGAYGAARVAGIALRDSATVGVLMNTRGVIAIILVTVGRDQGLVDDRLYAELVLMAIVTTLLTSPILRRTKPTARPAK